MLNVEKQKFVIKETGILSVLFVFLVWGIDKIVTTLAGKGGSKLTFEILASFFIVSIITLYSGLTFFIPYKEEEEDSL